jgi:hypothetical protein
MRGPCLLLAALAVGCGGTSAAFIEPCSPGQSIACTSADGCSGAQVCSPEGTGYGPCECLPDADAGADAPVATPDSGASPDSGSVPDTSDATVASSDSGPAADGSSLATTDSGGGADASLDATTVDSSAAEASAGDDASCGSGSGLPAGSYEETCHECSLAGTTLACTCLTVHYQPLSSTLNLCTCSQPPQVVNANGVLTCAASNGQ